MHHTHSHMICASELPLYYWTLLIWVKAVSVFHATHLSHYDILRHTTATLPEWTNCINTRFLIGCPHNVCVGRLSTCGMEKVSD